ncbi:MAG: serine/threonine-protein kinase [Deltaproteobacteria bacterium]|nr:serine/threonine-protein kinase [Deltaproteobacteria bacterium]
MTSVRKEIDPDETSDGMERAVVEVRKGPAVAAGKMLGRYRLDEVIGTGAFSTVFKAHDTSLDLPVVVKVLGNDASADAVERFRREILFSRRVAHPGFSRIFELHEEETFDGPVRYLTLELVEGRTLGDLMNEGPMPARRALTIARDLCDIVAAAHEQGVVHGDLKPSNVMVRQGARRSVMTDRRQEPRDELVILDFGAASAADMAHAGVRVGSVRYMAPELFEAESTSRQTDVWAIGVVLYGCLTGRFPFDGEGDRAVAEATRRVPPKPPSSVSPRVDSIIDPVVLRALRRERSDRYSDCRAFKRALDELLLQMRAPSLWQRFLRLVKPV